MSKNSKIEIFDDFFQKHRIDDESTLPITHTCIGKPYGKYSIPNKDLEKFYDLYSKALDEGGEYHITEQRKKASPLIIDLDIKQDLNHNKRYYTYENIEKVIYLYNSRIKKYVDIPDYKMQAFVFEKKEPNIRNNQVSDGVHILYPNVCIKNEISQVIRESVIKKINKKNYFENINHKNSLDSVFDKSVIEHTNWCLYGSGKPKSHKYTLSKIYSHDLTELDKNQYSDRELIELLSVRKFNESNILPIKPNVDKNELEKKLLSLNIKNKNDNKTKKTINDNVQKNIVLSNLIKNATDSEIETAKNLVKMLSPERASNYHDWIRVGWCLHNIDNNLLDDWIEFSKKTTVTGQYKKGDCEKKWVTFRDEGFSMGSLYHWAKADNIEAFMEYKKEKITAIINQNVNGTEYDVATVLHEMYQDVYACSSLKHKTWYEFKNHKWCEIDAGYTLYSKISEEIVNEYSKLAASIYNQVSQVQGIEKEALLNRIKIIQKVIDKLKSNTFKQHVMIECAHLFYDENFMDKLDENRDLICFNNGVFDLKNRYFRDGVPDDYISLCTNIDYIGYDENNQYVKQTYEFFRQLQPKQDMMEYVLTLLASYLQGHTPDEKFHLWTGTGCHAKDTGIKMYDGTTKLVQDIVIGDCLLGDDGTRRNVLQLFRGKDMMYKIKTEIADYIVNENHVLSLQANQIKKIKWDEEKNQYYLLYHKFNNGLLICRRKWFDKNTTFKQMDEFYDSLQNTVKKGDIIDITVKRYIKLDKLFNLNSCYQNYSVNEKNTKLYDFTIEKLDIDYYYGFELDGNHRYIMENSIVTHNSNGKSKSIELAMMALGDYAGTLPISLLTQKRSAAGTASPEMAMTKGKRFCIFQEPEDNDKIRVGLMKELTGGDKITARQLYKEPIEFKPQFKLLLTCNKLPYIPSSDGGTWRRLRVVEFKSKFVDVPDPKKPNEFKKDEYLQLKFENWKCALMSILIEKFYQYKKNGLVEPKEVTKFTNKYQESSDVYLEFINETIEISKKNEDHLSINAFYSLFKSWFKESYSDRKTPARREFKDYIEDKYKDKVKNGYVLGIVCKDNESSLISSLEMDL